MNKDFPSIEKDISELWDRTQTFETINRLQANRPLFNFFDGPPFATGLPHYGHILASTVKDTVLRFMSQSGYKVVRDFGWDCHGLPVEYEIDKTHNFSLEDIHRMGIDKYNQLCRSIVLKYTNEWKDIIKNLGRWTTYGYKTMDSEFMESVWRVFKVLFDMNLVYKGYRVMPYSTACTTPLSNFEANQNYKEVEDPATYVKFLLKKASGAINAEGSRNLFQVTSSTDSTPDSTGDFSKIARLFEESIENHQLCFLVFTTTPWTLPSNCGLAINRDFMYSIVDSLNIRYILLRDRVDDFFDVMNTEDLELSKLTLTRKENIQHNTTIRTENRNEDSSFGKYPSERGRNKPHGQILLTFSGTILLNFSYEPLFTNFTHDTRFFKIIHADFIDASTGTGIVHLAPGFGDEDYNCFVKNGIITMNAEVPCPVNESGQSTINPQMRIDPNQNVLEPFLKAREEIESTSESVNTIQSNVTSGDISINDGIVTLNLQNLYVKQCDTSILAILKVTDKLFKYERIVHRYPFCWRSDTPLIYKAIPNWFIKVSQFTRELTVMNEQISWIPKTISNKFGNWLENARDWSVSRNRFWGTPLPIWQHENEFICVGSIRELEELSGSKVFMNKAPSDHNCRSNQASIVELYDLTDIHRESVDHITIQKDGKTFKRVTEVMDCWFESGSMPYYQKRIRDLLSANVSINEECPTIHGYPLDFDAVSPGSQSQQPNKCQTNDSKPQTITRDDKTPVSSNIYHLSADQHTLTDFRRKFANLVPATFIAEGIDQTRGWFYTLHALSTILFEKPAFMNVICNGIVLAQDGKKMSKRLKNYPDPKHILCLYGADSLRLCLISSPVVMAENLLFNEERVKSVQKSVLLPLSNALRFYLDSDFVTLGDPTDSPKNESLSSHVDVPYDDRVSSQNDVLEMRRQVPEPSSCPMDEWILQRVDNLCAEIQIEMKSYILNGIQSLIIHFIEDLNNWYIRINRERIRSGHNTTLKQVLLKLAVILAPFIPFFSEYMFQEIIRKIRSEHTSSNACEIVCKQISVDGVTNSSTNDNKFTVVSGQSRPRETCGNMAQKSKDNQISGACPTHIPTHDSKSTVVGGQSPFRETRGNMIQKSKDTDIFELQDIDIDNYEQFLNNDQFISVHYMQLKPFEHQHHVFDQIKELINGFRFIREQKGISLKTPLRSGCIILHTSCSDFTTMQLPQECVQKYLTVIQKECNLLNLTISSEHEYEFKEEWLPNFETIKEHKKEKILIIRSLKKSDIHRLLKDKTIEVDLREIDMTNKVKTKKEKKKTIKNSQNISSDSPQNTEIDKPTLKSAFPSNVLETPQSSEGSLQKIHLHIDEIIYRKTLTSIKYPNKSTESATLVLNTDIDPELISMRNAREFYSWLQKLRKNNNLKMQDRCLVWLSNSDLKKCLETQYPQINFAEYGDAEADIADIFVQDDVASTVKLFLK